MNIIGFNVLATALGAIGYDTFVYRAYAGQTKSPSGYDTIAYAPGVTVQGSVQPMNTKDVFDRGLTATEKYVVVRGNLQFLEGGRDVSSDQIDFSGDKYQVISVADWAGQNGWSMAICQKIQANHNA